MKITCSKSKGWKPPSSAVKLWTNHRIMALWGTRPGSFPAREHRPDFPLHPHVTNFPRFIPNNL